MLLNSLLTITPVFTRAGVKILLPRKLCRIPRIIVSNNVSALPPLISNDGSAQQSDSVHS